MRIRTRILIGFILLYAIGSYFVYDMIVSDIRPRYLEAVEESLVDTAHLMASLIESDMSGGETAQIFLFVALMVLIMGAVAWLTGRALPV